MWLYSALGLMLVLSGVVDTSLDLMAGATYLEAGESTRIYLLAGIILLAICEAVDQIKKRLP